MGSLVLNFTRSCLGCLDCKRIIMHWITTARGAVLITPLPFEFLQAKVMRFQKGMANFTTHEIYNSCMRVIQWLEKISFSCLTL